MVSTPEAVECTLADEARAGHCEHLRRISFKGQQDRAVSEQMPLSISLACRVGKGLTLKRAPTVTSPLPAPFCVAVVWWMWDLWSSPWCRGPLRWECGLQDGHAKRHSKTKCSRCDLGRACAMPASILLSSGVSADGPTASWVSGLLFFSRAPCLSFVESFMELCAGCGRVDRFC